jgi:uncharacterized protein with HEPN domain
VSYRDRQRLDDIQAAIDAIRSHLQRGDLSDGLVVDAVRIRLLEIGEAVKALPDDLLATQPSIPWRQITLMRDHLAHRYFDTASDFPASGKTASVRTRGIAVAHLPRIGVIHPVINSVSERNISDDHPAEKSLELDCCAGDA